MKHLVATTIVAATLAGAASAEQYVCETEQSTGFVFRQGEWSHMQLPDEARYLIDTDTMTVSQFGSEGNVYEGDECFLLGRSNEPEFMRCLPEGRLGQMTMGLKTLRFDSTLHGYAIGDTEGGISLISIGTCAELDG